MAITMTDKDGSGQHFDTYAEFEQAMVLMSRIGGNKVPQDLMDEVSAKYGDKESKPIQLEIDGSKVAEAISKATEEIAEELDRLSMDRTPVSDECENLETEPKLEVGDKVYLTEDMTLDVTYGKAYEVVGFGEYHETGEELFEIFDDVGDVHSFRLKYIESVEEVSEDSPTEFRTGDIVLVTETFEDSYGDALHGGDLHRFGKLNSGRVCISAVFVDGDNIDKLQLVCRREDRKDIEL